MSGPGAQFTYADWLTLREPVDADARSAELAGWAAALLAGQDAPLVRDLGCGTGSMPRWLSPRLPAGTRWVLQDSEADVLERARAGVAGVEATVQAGVGALRADDLAGTSLVTCSALLDLLTADEIGTLAAACGDAGVPALLTLSVTGRVALAPPDPLDDAVAAAFDAHQCRDDRLGPEAAERAATAFAAYGTVLTRATPWRLGPERPELTAEWLRGRFAAAVEEVPDLAPDAAAHLDRRTRALLTGTLTAEVGHLDLLFVPPGGGS
ncbi:class I SAM-dependent methyltransferase [Pseudonocardia nematodicida]|uniref:Class I SAM-dependent methyltransferase n=1 Tax=Pseudonocardia nematodicida TaxID=1206997 RepID=A0ABV1KFY0_9PSEU